MASSTVRSLRLGSSSLLKRYSTASSQASSSSSASSSTSSPTPSSSSSSSWKPPIGPGVEPAYDEALKFISTQQAKYKQQIQVLEGHLKKSGSDAAAREVLEKKLKSFVIASQIDDPEVRWRYDNQVDAPLTNPVFAHLREKQWRESELPRLMQRIRLMNVLPDAIPSITPSVDLQVSFGTGKGIHDHGGEGGAVVPGCFVPAEKVREFSARYAAPFLTVLSLPKTIAPPSITATPFEATEKLYTLATIDLDAPYEAEQRLGTFAHWLVHDIPLSLTRTEVDMSQCTTTLPYIPPHPPKGMKYHRYATVLLQQPDRMPTLGETPEREKFSLHQFALQHSLLPAGIHFWRAIWSKEAKSAISAVYRDTLYKPEPLFVAE